MDEHEGKTYQLADDDEALSVLLHENILENVLPSSNVISSRDIPPTPQLLLNPKERMTSVVNEEQMDDDEIRTHRYWQKWGKKRAKDIVRGIQREVNNNKKSKRKELVYSARVRESVYDNISDSDTDATEISLLSCSTLAKPVVNFDKKEPSNRKRAKIKEKKEEEEKQLDWSKLSTKTGLISKMMAKDASALSSFVAGTNGLTQVFKTPSIMDYLSPEEGRLLTNVAYKKPGLHGRKKSESTENVISHIPKVVKKQSINETPRTPSATTASQVSRTTSNPKYPVPRPPKHAPPRGCTPTPKQIGDQFRLKERSESASGDLSTIQDRRMMTPQGVMVRSVFGTRHSAKTKTEPDSVSKYQQGLRGLPDFEGKFTRTVRQKIARTVSALSRSTGLGDSLNTMEQPGGEKGLYIEEDYAKLPKYPQRVLIAPSLSKVIRIDIKKRMGRPRYHEIKRADLRYFDTQHPPLDHYNRNLIIFNWLLSIDQENYEMVSEPKIFDLEGRQRKIQYGTVLFHGDIMNRAATAMSRVSTALEECSTFKTRSDFTGEVSCLEDDDDFSVGTADDISDFYSPSVTTISR